MLGSYVAEYFDKELSHVKTMYTSAMRKLLDDPQLMTAHTVLKLPQFKAERVRSISTFCKSVGNKSFVKSVLSSTTDAIVRMESIGRDDKKKLPIYTKELCLTEMSFLIESIFVPSLKQATNLLLKMASAAYNNSGSSSSGSNSATNASGALGGLNGQNGISTDALDLLAAVGAFRDEFGPHFTSLFQRPLSEHPNLLVIVKDARKALFQQLCVQSKEVLFAWELGLVMHIEKTLAVTQSKFDYAPKMSLKELSQNVAHWSDSAVERDAHSSSSANNNDSFLGHLVGNHGHIDAEILNPTAACDTVCRIIIAATQSIRANDPELDIADLDNVFWRPFGQQFVAILIAHLRKYKVSFVGAKQLMRDLDEYKNVSLIVFILIVVLGC